MLVNSKKNNMNLKKKNEVSKHKKLSPKETALSLFIVIFALAALIVRDHYSKPLGSIVLVAGLFIGVLVSLLLIKKDRENVGNGIHIIKDSIKTFIRFPILIIPLLFTWSIYAPIIVYVKFFMVWSQYSYPQKFFIAFGVILVFSFLISISCLVLLELLKQQESGRPMSIVNAVYEVVVRDLLKASPIALSWAFIWFVLTVLEAIFSRKSDEDESADFTPENVAQTLAGFENFTLSGALFEALKKGVRMVVFLILPAIAWENKSTGAAIKKGLGIIKAHKIEFATGFVMTELAAGVLFLVPALLFYLSARLKVHFPDTVWFITIIYIGFAWSYYFFLEQMFTAGLYLWHLSWERECIKAKAENRPLPQLSSVGRPTLLDDVPDLPVAKPKNRENKPGRSG